MLYWKLRIYFIEPLAKSRLGLGLLIETGTNITIVVWKRHLCPRSECELIDFARASIDKFSPARASNHPQLHRKISPARSPHFQEKSISELGSGNLEPNPLTARY